MKYLRILLFLASTFLMQQAFADDDHSLIPSDMQNYIGFGAIVAILLLFILVMLVLLRTFNLLTRIILKSKGYTEGQIIVELNPAKNQKKTTLSMYVVYSITGIAVTCLLFYVFSTGPSQLRESRTKEAQTQAVKKPVVSNEASTIDENTVKLVTDPAVLSSGKAVFMQSCSACHGVQAQGMVGPNLTDDYWLHGGKISDIYKTIKYGVPAKAMPTWEKLLTPQQISDVSNYIKSLRGTNPPNPKDPQGTKESL